MSNETSILGKIRVPVEWIAARESNLRVISELPDEDEWPPLVRDMFAVTPDSVSYRSRSIFFAAEIKGLDESWPEWLTKFEALLRRMQWNSVTLHLETEYHGDHDYWWVANNPVEGKPVAFWDSGGGPRKFER